MILIMRGCGRPGGRKTLVFLSLKMRQVARRPNVQGHYGSLKKKRRRVAVSQKLDHSDRIYDVLTMGRSSIDLYSNEIGAPFPQIKSFAAYVGGCPTNIVVGTQRLGLKSAVLTAVGNDPVGDFLLQFLEEEGVVTTLIQRKPGRRTSAVILGIEPPNKFPLVYYRDNCADIELTIDDVMAAPIADSRCLVISGR